MATSAKELTECVICAETFTDPQALPCDHVFCKKCVNRLTHAGTVKCPNCNKVCLRHDVKPDFRLNTFLDILATQSKPAGDNRGDITGGDVTSPHTEKCEACDENFIHAFCHQCQQWFCKVCTKSHAKIRLTKDHTYTSLATRNDNVKEQMKQEIKNLQDKATHINLAASKKIRSMAGLQATQKRAKLTSQQLRAGLHQDIDRHFDTLNEHIDSFCQNEHAFLNSLNCNTDDQLCELSAKMDRLLKQDNSVFAGAEELIAKAQELIKSVDELTDVIIDIPSVKIESDNSWNLKGVGQLHLHKAVAKKLKIQKSLLASIGQQQWNKQAKKIFSSYVCALRAINQQLLVCTESAIIVLDGDLKQLRTIPAGAMFELRDVAVTPNGFFVIASNVGLFYCQLDGILHANSCSTRNLLHSSDDPGKSRRLSPITRLVKSCIKIGSFNSVAFYREEVYAVAHEGPRTVYVYQRSGSSWVTVHSFSVAITGILTLSVTNNRIMICSDNASKIVVCSLRGELVQTFGSEDGEDASQFDCAYICTDDDEGSLIIADSDCDRLQVMTEQGEFTSMQLWPPVRRPTSAVLLNKKLYVISDWGKTLIVYT